MIVVLRYPVCDHLSSISALDLKMRSKVVALMQVVIGVGLNSKVELV